MSLKFKLLSLGIAAGCLTACGDAAQEPEVFHGECVSQIRGLVSDGSLLLHWERSNDDFRFCFETDTLLLSTAEVTEVITDDVAWRTTVRFADGEAVEVPSLGKSFGLSADAFEVNPTGYAPLSAKLTLSLPVEGRLKVCVKGKKGPATDLAYTFKKYGYNHQEYVHGLYSNAANTVYVTLTDKQGRERLTDSVTVVTPDIQIETKYPKIQTVVSKPEQMAEGITFVNHLGDNEYDTHRPFILDAAGDIRWLVWLKDHPDLKVTTHTGMKRRSNGNLFCGDVKTDRIVELDMVGNLVQSWDLKRFGYSFHHDVMELPNGHFLATASKADSKDDQGESTIYDYVVELDPERDAIVTVWDLKQSLDIHRTLLKAPSEGSEAGVNWAHDNGLCYSADDDCIIVTMRYQGIAKLTRQNQLVWVLSPQKGWTNPVVANYSLNPLDSQGQTITDQKVISGEAVHPDFEYAWGAHCPTLMPNGHLLVFDNGYYRHFFDYSYYYNYQGPDPNTGEDGYSRAVEYEIDETRRTVRQVWQFGHERYRTSYAPGCSSVQYLPETDHVLFCPGVGTANVNGLGGQIIEVDYRTKEVVYEVHVSVPALLAFHRATRMSLYPDNV